MSDTTKIAALIGCVAAAAGPVWLAASMIGYSTVNHQQLRTMELTADVRLAKAVCKEDKDCLRVKLMMLSIGF
jgi:UDP-N-acetylglucosamine:LPS N-acetylglucosamine transferase